MSTDHDFDNSDGEDNFDDEDLTKRTHGKNKLPKEDKKKPKSYDELDEHIKGELDNYIHFVINYEPAKFYIADSVNNQIVRGYVGKKTIYNDLGELIDEVDKLRVSIPFINAIPTKVIQYTNTLSTGVKYKITFVTNTKKTFTAHVNTIENILEELHGRGLIIVKREAEAALTGILNTMENKGKIEITNQVEQPGFYLSPDNENKIECFGLTFKDPTDDDIKTCCDFINLLVEKYVRKDEKGNIINDRATFPVTMLKWGIAAPFNWIMKCYDKWVNWLHLGGESQTAKNTLAELVMAMWRVHKKSGHIIPFASTNNDARLGQAISRTTLPININEVQQLSDQKHEGLVATIKGAIDGKDARGKFSKKNFEFIPSLSAVILTGNGMPPNDTAYRSKCKSVIFTIADKYDRDGSDAIEFRKWLTENINLLGTLGDFTQKYIINNPQILKEKTWYEIGAEVLGEFYVKAGIDKPTWINEIAEYKEQIEQTQDEIVLQLRGYFITLINDTSNRYRPPRYISETELEENPFNSPTLTLTGKLKACCRLNLIPFIHMNKDNTVFYITKDIMHDLIKYNRRLADAIASHKGLADQLSFKYKAVRVGNNDKTPKAVIIPDTRMKEMLEFNDIEEIPDKTDNKQTVQTKPTNPKKHPKK